MNGEARPLEVPNQYQILRLHAGGVARWTRRYSPGKKRWEGDTSCSPDGDEWRIDHEVAFKSVDGAFESGAATAPREPDPAERLEHKFEQRDRGEGFLARVLEICKLRYRGEGTKIDALNENSRYPYLRVYARDGNVVRSFPIGLVEGVISEELVEGFCDKVFDGYRALDPNLRCTIVYGGDLASEELVRAAGARNVELCSFVEFQGIIDFRGYVERETRRLGSDVVYPPGLYVPQSLVYEIGAERHKSSNALDEMMGWLCEPHARFVLVLGDFGAGKTFLLRELARRMPGRLPHLVPVFVELRSLEKVRTFDQLIVQHLATAGERRFDLDAFRYMLREGRIVLLFDGFDELAERVTYRRATEHFETLLQAAGDDAKVLVTSRTQHFESDRQVRKALLERAEMLPSLSLCRIQPFGPEQIVAFLTNRLGDKRKARERFELIDEIKDLLGLSHNPRMLSFIADIPEQQLREARERTGTITAAELYRLLIERWLEHELDKSQPPDTELALLRKQRWEAVTALALRLWTKTDRTIHVSELTEQVSATVQQLSLEPHEGAPLDPESVAHLVGSRTLLVRDEEGAFAFVHASVMEWLVASEVATRIADGVEPEALGEREMTALMTDFVCDLADREGALAWARKAIAGDERSPARANALLVLDRLGEQADEAALSGGILSGRDLSGRDLADAKFAGTDLTEASLARSDLSRADLTGTRLVRADLTRAVMAGATLDGADARGARLLGADLR
ncbi:MAG TPA: pentapeptide repeat-containing protein, partial [Solirubrobacteraceae bacterium]|nr:pentapeptide repeat-containing protein [Solirubrobacteraceae bacterium]